MATEGRRADSPLVKVFFDEAYRFDFFQAVRLLERMFPERQPVGRGGDPSREVVRFRTRVSLEFPASQIHQIEGDPGGNGNQPPQMIVSFMGLTGQLGVLPYLYTELLLDRTKYQDTALWEFLDLFNHRMISLFYCAWEKYRFPVAYERGEQDRFTEYLFDIIGLGTHGLRNRIGVQDEGLLYYSGLIAQRPHSPSASEAILGDYFGVKAKLEQFCGQWLTLDDENLTRLGASSNQLGVNMIAGARVWDNQSKFRLKFGPLTFTEFAAFLPVGTAFGPVTNLMRFLAGEEFDFDIQLVLKAKEVPSTVLTTQAKRRPMLGWTTWLKTREFIRDDSQVILSTRGA